MNQGRRRYLEICSRKSQKKRNKEILIFLVIQNEFITQIETAVSFFVISFQNGENLTFFLIFLSAILYSFGI